MPAKAKVLFLCTRNSVRSQMAEALLRRYAGEAFDVYSAGVIADPIHPYSIEVMREVGIDLSQQQPKTTRTYLGHTNFGYVITVSDEAEENAPTTFLSQGAQRLKWPFEDPARFHGTEAEKLAKFREVRDQIDAKIREWLAEMNLPLADSPSTVA